MPPLEIFENMRIAPTQNGLFSTQQERKEKQSLERAFASLEQFWGEFAT